MHGLFYKIRGVNSWPECTATVSSIEVISDGGRSGLINRIFFTYSPESREIEEGKLTVDSYSSLYNLEVGDTFTVQYDPKNPQRIYSEEAKSAFLTIRKTIITVGVIFAIVVFLIQFLGSNSK